MLWLINGGVIMFKLKKLKQPIDLGFIEITKSYTETKPKEKRK